MQEKQAMRDLRNMLGVLGMLLPVLSLIFNLVFGQNYNPSGVLTSISATHYSSSYLLFEGLVFSVGLFFIMYRGYDIKDRIFTIVAGCGAIILTLFPVSLGSEINNNFLMLPTNISNVFHFTGAFTFFAAITIIVLFQFTQSDKDNPSKGKVYRNMLYRICGGVMIAALILGFTLPWKYAVYAGEAVALWAFGVAFLTKGRIIR